MLAKQVGAYAYSEPIDQKLASSAVIEGQSELHSGSDGSEDSLWTDGYPMTVTPKTRMLAAPAATRLRYSWYRPARFKIVIEAKATRTPLRQIVFHEPLLLPDTCIQYAATSNVNGEILANQLILWPNHIDKRERKYINRFAASIDLPNYQKQIPGDIYFRKVFKRGIVVHIVPDQGVQEWVSDIGRGMVPQFQRSMSDNDPDKVRFRFYVTEPFRYEKFLVRLTHGGESKHVEDNTIVALPNGIILIPATTLVHLQNRAQFAALISTAVTSVLQKQAYLHATSITQYTAAIESTERATLLMQDQQMLRIGIRQMYLAGYDIREAPFAWAVAQGKPVSNPVIDSKHPDKEIPWYAAYAFNYISQYYQNVAYSKLKRGRKEYQQFLQELYKADPSLKHPEAQASKQ